MNSTSIYSIYKATNIINGKCYIGFTKDYSGRVYAHKRISKKKNTKFYEAIKDYSWSNFKWEIIYQSYDGEYTLRIMEPYFIEQYDSYNNGYNSTKGGEGCLSGFTPGKHFIICEPNGNVLKIYNLSKYCRDNGLSYSNFITIVNSETEHYRGFRIKDIDNNTPFVDIKQIRKRYIITSPNGHLYETYNLKQFSENNGLCYSGMGLVSRNERKQYKGWKVLTV